jgi:hypothetical protein
MATGAAYGQPKTANALFAVALDAPRDPHGIRAVPAHPAAAVCAGLPRWTTTVPPLAPTPPDSLAAMTERRTAAIAQHRPPATTIRGKRSRPAADRYQGPIDECTSGVAMFRGGKPYQPSSRPGIGPFLLTGDDQGRARPWPRGRARRCQHLALRRRRRALQHPVSEHGHRSCSSSSGSMQVRVEGRGVCQHRQPPRSSPSGGARQWSHGAGRRLISELSPTGG